MSADLVGRCWRGVTARMECWRVLKLSLDKFLRTREQYTVATSQHEPTQSYTGGNVDAADVAGDTGLDTSTGSTDSGVAGTAQTDMVALASAAAFTAGTRIARGDASAASKEEITQTSMASSAESPHGHESNTDVNLKKGQ